jgi:uncharacterized protein YkwD
MKTLFEPPFFTQKHKDPMKHMNQWMLALAVATTLTACGGGSSGPTSAPMSGSSPTPAPAPHPSVSMSSPTPNYSSSEDAAIFTILNTLRLGAGVGSLAQNTKLDTAAKHHSSYVMSNNLQSNSAYLSNPYSLHWEDAQYPGFTGAMPIDRLQYVGYTGAQIGENVSLGTPLTGALCIQTLIDQTVYHRASLLSSAAEVGVSIISDSGNTTAMCTIELGGTGFDQLPADATVYPYDRETGLPTTFYTASEWPNPAPDLPQTGVPVMISFYSQKTMPSVFSTFAGSDVVVTGFSIVQQGGSTPLASRVLTASGVTSLGPTLMIDSHLRPGVLFLLPTTQLQVNTTYTVTFTGTVKGVAVTKTWSFGTGAA